MNVLRTVQERFYSIYIEINLDSESLAVELQFLDSFLSGAPRALFESITFNIVILESSQVYLMEIRSSNEYIEVEILYFSPNDIIGKFSGRLNKIS